MKEFKMRLSHSPKINYMDVSASLPPEFLPNQHKENVKFVKAEIDFFLLGRKSQNSIKVFSCLSRNLNIGSETLRWECKG